MSKIRELIEEIQSRKYLPYGWSDFQIMKEIEQAIKAEVMGVKQHKEIGWIGIEKEDLENLFSEVER